MKHTISVLVENEFGVLSRVSGLFSGRGFNIESLSVAQSLDPKISRMTIVTEGNDKIVEQILKHLNKLINVLKVQDMSEVEHCDKELVLVKINAEAERRAEMLKIADIFKCKILDTSPTAFILEITGDERKIADFLELIAPFGIKEIVRTGKVAMARSSKAHTKK